MISDDPQRISVVLSICLNPYISYRSLNFTPQIIIKVGHHKS